MNRADILAQASTYVTKDRNTSYGEPEDNFSRIAILREAWAKVRSPDFPPAANVAVEEMLLKLARLSHNWTHQDSWVDGCGYFACGGEIATASAKTPTPNLTGGFPPLSGRRHHP